MITLRKVDDTNVREITALTVRKDQQDFVTSARDSVPECREINASGAWAEMHGIYDDETPVGFVMFTYETTPGPDSPPVAAGNYDISHFYIDKRYQGRGYGRAGLRLAIDYLHTLPAGKADCIWIAWHPDNHIAEQLYASVGFVRTDMRNYHEIVSVMPIGRETEA